MTSERSIRSPSQPSMPVRRGMLARRAMLALPGLAILLGVSGCGSAEPNYYTLTPQPGQRLAGGPASIEVRTPSVASYLDRDAIVRNEANHQLVLARGNLWASPLPGMIGRNLMLDLAQRLPDGNVTTQDDAISTQAVVRIELDISSFMENAQGMADLAATLSVTRAGSDVARHQSLHLTGVPSDGSVNAMVASLSALLGQVADRAAALCRALPPEKAGP